MPLTRRFGFWADGRSPRWVPRICRPNAHGDSQDLCSVLFEYADGVIHEHSGMAIPNATLIELTCNICSPTVNARLAYDGQVHFHRRGQRRFQAVVTDLYGAGSAKHHDILPTRDNGTT